MFNCAFVFLFRKVVDVILFCFVLFLDSIHHFYHKQFYARAVENRRRMIAEVDDAPHESGEPHVGGRVVLIATYENWMWHRQQSHHRGVLQVVQYALLITGTSGYQRRKLGHHCGQQTQYGTYGQLRAPGLQPFLCGHECRLWREPRLTRRSALDLEV